MKRKIKSLIIIGLILCSAIPIFFVNETVEGATVNLRPNWDILCQWGTTGILNHYTEVDDAFPDDDTTYNWIKNTAGRIERYALPDISTSSEIDINYIRFYVRARTNTGLGQGTVRLYLDAESIGDLTFFGSSYSTQYVQVKNPDYTAEDINDMQITVEFREGGGGSKAFYMTQCFLHINYDAIYTYPEINNPSPHESMTEPTDTELSIDVEEPTGDDMTIKWYDYESGIKLKEEEAHDGTYTCDWNTDKGLHQWNVSVNDTYLTNYSDVFWFCSGNTWDDDFNNTLLIESDDNITYGDSKATYNTTFIRSDAYDVASSSDDGYSRENNPLFHGASSSYYVGGSTTTYDCAIKFSDIAITGTLLNASLYCYGKDSGNALTRIFAEDSATPSIPSNRADHVTKTRTENGTWANGSAPSTYSWYWLPEITDVIQELDNKYTYDGDDSILILWDNQSTPSSWYYYTYAEDYSTGEYSMRLFINTSTNPTEGYIESVNITVPENYAFTTFNATVDKPDNVSFSILDGYGNTLMSGLDGTNDVIAYDCFKNRTIRLRADFTDNCTLESWNVSWRQIIDITDEQPANESTGILPLDVNTSANVTFPYGEVMTHEIGQTSPSQVAIYTLSVGNNFTVGENSSYSDDMMLTTIAVGLNDQGSPTGRVVCQLWDVNQATHLPEGDNISYGILDASEVDGIDMYEFEMNPVFLKAGVEYAFTVFHEGGDGANYVKMFYNNPKEEWGGLKLESSGTFFHYDTMDVPMEIYGEHNFVNVSMLWQDGTWKYYHNETIVEDSNVYEINENFTIIETDYNWKVSAYMPYLDLYYNETYIFTTRDGERYNISQWTGTGNNQSRWGNISQWTGTGRCKYIAPDIYDETPENESQLERNASGQTIGVSIDWEGFNEVPGDLNEYYDTGQTAENSITDGSPPGQTFTIGSVGEAKNISLDNISVYLKTTGGTVSNTFIVKLYSTDDEGEMVGDVLATGYMDTSDVTDSYDWYNVSMGAYELKSGTQYGVTFGLVNHQSSPTLKYGRDGDSSTYPGGTYVTTTGNPVEDDDFLFKIYGKEHMLNISFYDNTSSSWDYYGSKYLNQNGSVSILDTNYNYTDRYYWNVSVLDIYGSVLNISDTYQFDTIRVMEWIDNITGYGYNISDGHIANPNPEDNSTVYWNASGINTSINISHNNFGDGEIKYEYCDTKSTSSAIYGELQALAQEFIVGKDGPNGPLSVTNVSVHLQGGYGTPGIGHIGIYNIAYDKDEGRFTPLECIAKTDYDMGTLTGDWAWINVSLEGTYLLHDEKYAVWVDNSNSSGIGERIYWGRYTGGYSDCENYLTLDGGETWTYEASSGDFMFRIYGSSGAMLNVTLSTNESGSWVDYHNETVYINKTVSATNTNFDTNGTKYYWRVNATNNLGWTNSTIYDFKINKRPTLHQEYPANGSSGIERQADIWFYINDTNENQNVTVYVQENTTGEWITRMTYQNVTGNASLNWTNALAELHLTDYWWRVIADDGSGNETYPPMMMTTRGDEEPQVSVVSPENNTNDTKPPVTTRVLVDVGEDNLYVSEYYDATGISYIGGATTYENNTRAQTFTMGTLGLNEQYACTGVSLPMAKEWLAETANIYVNLTTLNGTGMPDEVIREGMITSEDFEYEIYMFEDWNNVDWYNITWNSTCVLEPSEEYAITIVTPADNDDKIYIVHTWENNYPGGRRIARPSGGEWAPEGGALFFNLLGHYEKVYVDWYTNKTGTWEKYASNESYDDGLFRMESDTFDEYEQTYYWNVSVWDEHSYNDSQWWTFNTHPYPMFSNESPENNSEDVEKGPILSIDINSTYPSGFNITWYSNSSGEWLPFHSQMGIHELLGIEHNGFNDSLGDDWGTDGVRTTDEYQEGTHSIELDDNAEILTYDFPWDLKLAWNLTLTYWVYAPDVTDSEYLRVWLGDKGVDDYLVTLIQGPIEEWTKFVSYVPIEYLEGNTYVKWKALGFMGEKWYMDNITVRIGTPSQNGTYYANNCNFTDGGKTYYWNVSVWDGYCFNESDWFKFTTEETWVDIDTWNVTIANILSWVDIDTWNVTLANPATWRSLDTWNITLANIASWNALDQWNITLANPATWTAVDTWNITMSDGNREIIISNPYPEDGQILYGVSELTLKVDIVDPDGDLIDWEIELKGEESISATNDVNGTKEYEMPGIDTKAYIWNVKAVDRNGSRVQVNRSYRFIIGYLIDHDKIDIEVRSPTDGYLRYTTTFILITTTRQGVPIEDKENDISIDIYDPNEVLCEQDRKPDACGEGIYKYIVDLEEYVEGEYIANVEVQHEGLTYNKACQFTMKENEYDQYLRLIERLGNYLYMRNNTMNGSVLQIIRNMREYTSELNATSEIAKTKHKAESITDILIKEIMKNLFSITLVSAFTIMLLLARWQSKKIRVVKKVKEKEANQKKYKQE